MFRRKVYQDLLEWKRIDNGSTALLLEGARRIGKTTVVEEFARNEYRSYILVDFSKDDDPCKDLFSKSYTNLDDLFKRLQLNSGKMLYPKESAIIFDEVQLQPRARQMIKSLLEDGRYHYIETGSLITLKKIVRNIRLPSGEHKIQMYPMDFEEWLWANGIDQSETLRELVAAREPLGPQTHAVMSERFRTYLMVGGMPQAVEEFLNTNNFMSAERRKREILDLYRDDIDKMSGAQAMKIKTIFESIPTLLSSHSSTFSPGKVMPGSRSRAFTEAIAWLIEARYVNPCYLCSEPSTIPGLTADRSKVKLYLLDTGLLFTLAFGKNTPGLEHTFRDILDGKMSVNGGMFFENYVAQQLATAGRDLFFHEFKVGKKRFEIDFLLSSARGIIPVEVKSSSSVRHKSLDEFRAVYGKRIGDCIVIHKKDTLYIDGVTFLPAYLVPFALVRTEREEALETFRLAREAALKRCPNGMTLDEINELIDSVRKEKNN